MKIIVYPLGLIQIGENVRRHLGDCTELAISIATQGLQQPLVVRLVEPRAAPELAPLEPRAGVRLVPELVQGYRRRAALLLLQSPPDELREKLEGLPGAYLVGADDLTVPCRIFDGDERAAWLSQFTDAAGQRLTVYELGSRTLELSERGIKSDEIARALGRSDRWVDECAAIVKGLCPEIRRALERSAELRDYRFTFDRLKRWSRLPDEQQRKEFFELCPSNDPTEPSASKPRQRGKASRLDRARAQTMLEQARKLHEKGHEGWSRVIAVLRHLLEGTDSPLPKHVRHGTARTSGKKSNGTDESTSTAGNATTSTARSPSPNGSARS